MNLQAKLLAGTLVLAGAGLSSRRAVACTMPLPNPGPSNEYEIEVEYEDYDFDTNKVRYKVDQVNGSPIQFGAGSNEPGHALNLFSGYQATLQLPSLSALPSADFDFDGDIDGADLLAFQRGFGITADARQQDGDADHDFEVDDDDFKVWKIMYGTAGINPSAVTVPEPASLLLLATALGGCVIVGRRRFRWS